MHFSIQENTCKPQYQTGFYCGKKCYHKNPFGIVCVLSCDIQAERISYVDKVTPEMLDFTAGKGSWLGTGGMATKITAMSKVTEHGIMGVIADGSSVQTLEKIIDQDDVGTFFAAQ